jgi:hypothetical protein
LRRIAESGRQDRFRPALLRENGERQRQSTDSEHCVDSREAHRHPAQ